MSVTKVKDYPDIKMHIVRIPANMWRVQFSESAHLAVFKEKKPMEWDRIDFALLGIQDSTPAGYVTVRELSHNTCYMQYGGAFESVEKSLFVFRVYKAFVDYLKEVYPNIQTYIENTNTAMLKMAMKMGFLITGIRNFQGSIMLEHTILGGENA